MRSVFCGRDKEMTLLKAAWGKASNKEKPQPQLVVLLAESGLGKTRVAQEFYGWLSTHHDETEPKGYWPDDLGQEENNLKVNPAPDACDNNNPMPYLWWGVRIADPGSRNSVQGGSALSTYQNALTPHLNPILNQLREVGRRVEGGKTVAQAVVDIGLSFIPGAGALGPIKTGAEALYNLVKLGKASVDDRKPHSLGDVETQAHKSLSDLTLEGLAALVTGANGALPTVPTCLLIDDAQFSDADPSLSAFMDALIARAFKENWPLLIIVTHWKAEWRVHWAIEGSTIAAVIRKHQTLIGDAWQPQSLLPIDGLRPMLQQALPGLAPEQQIALLERAGGNPRYLDEVIRLCQRRPRNFVERNLGKPLTQQGLEECLSRSLSLHELIEDRLEAMPIEVKQAISIASMQGLRFLNELTEEVANALLIGKTGDGLKGAEHPHSLINSVAQGVAEFAQRVFHQVASEALADVVDVDKAQDVLATLLRQRLDGEMDGAIEQQEMLLAVAVGLFEQADNEADRHRAAHALAKLTNIELARYDYAAALSFSQHFIAGVGTERWAFTELTFSELWYVFDAVWEMRCIDDSLRVAEAMQQDAQQRLLISPEDDDARRDLSISWGKLGNIARATGDLPGALSAYQKGLVISEQLAEELNTPEARRNLYLSWDNLGDMARETSDLPKALSAYQKGHVLSQRLAEELKTPEAYRDLSVSWNKLGNMARETGDLAGALSAYQKGRVLREQLAKELNTPQARRDLSVSWARLGSMADATGDLLGALSAYQKGHILSERLAAELSTPQARRDLSVSWRKLGDMVRATGDLPGALSAYQKGQMLSKQLAEELDTPESRCDLSSSWDKLGDMACERGDLPEALSAYQKGQVLRERLAEELNTPEAHRNLFLSWNNLGNMAHAMGDLPEALSAYQKVHVVSEHLAEELNTPRARRDLSISWDKLGDMARERGELLEALSAYQKGHVLSERLAAELNTSLARRDLSFSWDKLGDMAHTTSDLPGALSAYQKGQVLREQLAEELNTPEAHRDLMVSYSKLAKTEEDADISRQHYFAALAQARLYQGMQPCPDADDMVAHFEKLCDVE